MPETANAPDTAGANHGSNAVLEEISGRLDAVPTAPWRVIPVTDGIFAGVEVRIVDRRFNAVTLGMNDGEPGQVTAVNGEFIAHAPDDMRKALHTLQAVLTLHACDDRADHCVECSSYAHEKHVPWPCPTVQTVTAALEGKL